MGWGRNRSCCSLAWLRRVRFWWWWWRIEERCVGILRLWRWHCESEREEGEQEEEEEVASCEEHVWIVGTAAARNVCCCVVRIGVREETWLVC